MEEIRVCARCGTANVDRESCVACDASLSVSDEPSAGRDEFGTGVPVPSFEAPPRRAESGPNIVDVTPRPVAAAPEGGSGGRRRVAPVIAAVVVALVVGAGAALVFRGSSGSDRSSEVTSGGARTDTSYESSTEEPETEPVPTLALDPVVPESDPDSSATPATAPTVSAPPSTVDTTGWEPFSDTEHYIRMLLPPDLVEVDAFDGTKGRWVGQGVTVFYEVEPYSSVAEADGRANSLSATIVGPIYDSRGKKESHQQDGRYVVSGRLESDGTNVYERGRIRCGDLVRYRLQWSDQVSKPFVDLLTKAWVNAEPDLDAMGGVHATC